MRPDQQRVRDVVVETIRLLCRTGLHFQKNLQVQGLLGITVDDDQVFLIHVNDSVVRTIEQPGFPFSYLAAAADASGRTAAICHTDPSGNCGCDPMQLQQQQMVLERQQQQQQHHEVPCTVSVGIPEHHEQSMAGAAMPEVIDPSCPPNSALMYEQMDQKNTVASASETYVHCPSNDTSVQMVDEAAVAAASVSNYNQYMASEVHDNRPTIVAIPTYPGGLPQVDGSGGMITGARLDNGLPPDMAVTSVAYVMAPPPGSIIEFVPPPPPVSRSDSNASVGKPAGGVVEMLQEEQVVTEEVVSTAPQQQQQLPDETDPESVAAQNAANDVAVLAAAAAAAEVKTEGMPPVPNTASSSQVPMTFNSDDSCSETDDDEKYSDTSGSVSEGHPGSGAGGALKQELILQSQMSPGALAAAGVTPGSWPVPLQRSLSDSCGDDNAWRLQASVLAGVMPPGGPHSSAYYQQQILAAAAAAAHNRAARAAAGSGPRGGNGEPSSSISALQQQQSLQQPQGPLQTPTQPAFRHKIKQQMSSPPLGGGSGGSSGGSSHRRLPRRPRESEDKRFRCPFCELAYYHKKHLKYHLAKKHGL